MNSPHEPCTESGWQRVTNWLAVLVLLSLGFVWPAARAQGIADRGAAGATAAAAARASDVQAGTLQLKASADAAVVAALRQSSAFSAHVTGNVARVYVTQTFTNPSEDWVEGRYVFPLSAGAAVDELEMKVGERLIRGEIQERAAAKEIFEQAKRDGRQASLVDQNRPNMFTTSVANIPPGATVSIRVAYLESLALRDGRYTLSLPLAITPRYTPEGATDVPADSGVDVAANVVNASSTPEKVTGDVQAVAIDVDLDAGFPIGSIRSLNHPVTINGTGADRKISLSESSVPADRDFELVWTAAVRSETQVAAFAEPGADGTYVLLMLTPPEQLAPRTGRREVIFIIDTSGSMYGPSIDQAREALQLGVDRLAPTDRFNVIRFSSDATELFPSPKAATIENRESARRFIGSLRADGGTEMRTALELAFATPSPEDALRQIVFITDGSVGNEADLIKMIHDRLGSARLFTVGIGADPNVYFMNEAAVAGRGSYTFISQRDLVRERMADLFRKLEQPALVDLSLTWPGGVAAELAAPLPADLYAGDPLVVAARLPAVSEGVLTLSGSSGGGNWSRQIPLEAVGEQSGVAKLWARERIGQLSREGRFAGHADQSKPRIVELALAHHLVSDFTSLVAVDVTPVRPNGTGYVQSQAPTSAPTGSYWSNSAGFPSTATPAPLLTLAGALALLAAGALMCFRVRPRRRLQ